MYVDLLNLVEVFRLLLHVGRKAPGPRKPLKPDKAVCLGIWKDSDGKGRKWFQSCPAEKQNGIK